MRIRSAAGVWVGVAGVIAAAMRSRHVGRAREFSAIEALARAIDARDQTTAGHSARVAEYALLLAHHLSVPSRQHETLRRASLLHDIGKVGVPDEVLLKPGPLDPTERARIELHVTIGVQMLEGVSFLGSALPVIRSHHERWDGAGYPDRLSGGAIPLLARLVAVADSFDAMTSPRPYRLPLPFEEAARRLRADAGRQFDHDVVAAFTEREDLFGELLARRPHHAGASEVAGPVA